MEHTVTFQLGGEWKPYATFAYHNDAVFYAKTATGYFKGVLARVAGGANYVDLYFCDGEEIVGPEQEA